jgi:3alpha(or 20beta)-hydroxysteroid dehydrogenase
MAYEGTLSDKIVLVAGGAAGQGRGTAIEMARRGAKVVVADITVDEGEAVAKEIGSAAIFQKLDVSNPDNWAAVVKKAEDTFGTINVMCHPAGRFKTDPLMDVTMEEHMRTIGINQIGPFIGIQAVVPGMTKLGEGSIIITVSMANVRPVGHAIAYSSTKAAATVMVKVAAAELAPLGIRVNTISPGAIDGTKMFGDVPEEFRQGYLKAIPIGRFGYPIDIANLSCFLASEQSSYITGSDFCIDGGLFALGSMQ